MKLKSIFYLFFFGCIFINVSQAQANVVYSANTHVELVSSYRTVVPGQKIQIALRMKMDPEWHVYWRNPGDSGLPPKIVWQAPEGIHVAEMQWPLPEQISIEPLMTYGYHGEVLFPFEVMIDKSYAVPFVMLSAKVQYLACKIECVPGEIDLTLRIPVSHLPQEHPLWYKAIQTTQKKLPVQNPPIKYQFIDDGDAYLLQWADASMTNNEYYFYAYREDVVDHPQDQVFSYHKGVHQLRLLKSPVHAQDIHHIVGILYSSKGWPHFSDQNSIYIQGPVLTEPNALVSSKSSPGLWLILLFAFFGGVILNLMPCVLPVLSIKVLKVMQQVGHDRRSMMKEGVQLSFGILSAFWVLALLLIILQKTGQEIGWGFQFQSPFFVVAMSVLFFVLALNLFGVFEMGAVFTRFQFANKTGSFWEGVLATIAATPCTAPFMGTALGYGLTQPAHISLLIFTFLGLGLAAPFLLLIAFPKAMDFLPKPGPWMMTLKRFFGMLFLFTVAWLLWVLNSQKGFEGLLYIIIALTFLGLACWCWGQKIQNPIKRNKHFFIIFYIAMVGALFLMYRMTTVDEYYEKEARRTTQGIDWEYFSPELIQKYRKENRVIFLDFTARWCLTCKVNEYLAFSNKEVIVKFKETGIVPVKADWTNYDEDITRALSELGRNSIPLYVIYPVNQQDPIILPELLTPKIVLDALENQ